jgi:hypothetical protein
MTRSETKEGKIELKADIDGLFMVDSKRLIDVNSQDEVMIATRKGGTAVKKGDKLAGMRVIPLIIEDEKLRKAEEAAGGLEREGTGRRAGSSTRGCSCICRRCSFGRAGAGRP